MPPTYHTRRGETSSSISSSSSGGGGGGAGAGGSSSSFSDGAEGGGESLWDLVATRPSDAVGRLERLVKEKEMLSRTCEVATSKHADLEKEAEEQAAIVAALQVCVGLV
jgi:hypothetical protein